MRLTRSANHSVLWFAIAAVLAARAGVTRRGALRGVIAIGFASATANGVLKPLVPRRRPAAELLPISRRLENRPTSSSFPSGHAASAAAFATAVGLESPRTGLALAPLAAFVAYSRVHVGVHWASDVAAGASIGAAAALITRRWWPVRPSDEAAARPMNRVPELPEGEGLVFVVNPMSGDAEYDPTEQIQNVFPKATMLVVGKGTELRQELVDELKAGNGSVHAVGVAGGDGTVATVAAFANENQLPLVLIPAGTLNHFARDVGIYDLQEAIDATDAGEAAAVTLGVVELHDAERERKRYFLNTASLGCYSDLVRLREQWEDRWGKWPAFLVALVVVLHRSEPLQVKLNGSWRSVWVLFVGNGPYHPAGMVPAWRPQLDSGLLDVRWLRADIRFSRLRACFALALAALSHSHVYKQADMSTLDVELATPSLLATDGEVIDKATKFTFRASSKPVPIYRRDESNPRWANRDRPHHPW